jgi:hypothetical protein
MSHSKSPARRAASVLERVHAAFGKLALPSPDEIIGGRPSQRDLSGSEKIREALAGVTWQELKTEFLQGAWSSFCYLSASGYRYYLPSLLKQCLFQWPSKEDLIHSTVFGLLPSFYELYAHNRDIDFDEQTSAFDENQYAAVCSFLELAFDNVKYQYLAGQALRWGWNRIEHPVHQRVDEHYRAFYQYQWLDHADPTIQKLIADIHAAFAERPYPGDDESFGSHPGPDDEPAGYALEFRGQDWRRLHPDFLNYNYACLSFFTEAGFRHYLPAYLITDLHGQSTSDVLFHLTHGIVKPKTLDLNSFNLSSIMGDDAQARMEEFKAMIDRIENDRYDWNAMAQSKFSGFSLPERKAIVCYLAYRALDEFHRDEIEQALASFWLPSLKQK